MRSITGSVTPASANATSDFLFRLNRPLASATAAWTASPGALPLASITSSTFHSRSSAVTTRAAPATVCMARVPSASV